MSVLTKIKMRIIRKMQCHGIEMGTEYTVCKGRIGFRIYHCAGVSTIFIRNRTIAKIVKKKQTKDVYFLGCYVGEIRDTEAFAAEKILPYIKGEFDDVYIFKHHIGEIYIYLNIVRDYIRHNGSNNPILLVNEERYLGLYNMFVPDLRKVLIPVTSEELDKYFRDDEVYVGKHRIFCPINDRFGHLRDMIEYQGNVHFYQYICDALHVPVQKRLADACFSAKLCKETIKQVKQLRLKKDRFVVFFPEAVTASMLREQFWLSLGMQLKERGYDIFINQTGDSPYYKCFKSARLSPAQVLYLCFVSKGVFALVNGLVVCTANFKIPRFFIYTRQTPTIGKRLTAGEMLDAYELAKIGGVQKEGLHEINGELYTEKKLIRYMIQEFEGTKQ